MAIEDFNTTFQYYAEVRALSSLVVADQTNFPIYFNASSLPTSIFNTAQNGGGDIRFADADWNRLPVEIVRFDTSINVAEIHVRATSLSSSSNTLFYVIWGNATATQPAVTDTFGRNNVWSNSFIMVHHFDENPSTDTGNYIDSTGNGNNGTFNTSGTPTRVNGHIGRAIELNRSSSEFTDHGDIAAIDGATALSVTSWARVVTTTADGFLISKGNFAANQSLLFWWDLTTSSGSRPQTKSVQIGTGSAQSILYGDSNSWANTNWNHLAFSYIGSTSLNSYMNGVQDTQTPTAAIPAAMGSDADTVRVGASFGGSPFFDGEVDEMRVHSVGRSISWIQTEYNNTTNASAFYIVGAAQTFARPTTQTYMIGDVFF
jgi:hypothetical protein